MWFSFHENPKGELFLSPSGCWRAQSSDMLRHFPGVTQPEAAGPWCPEKKPSTLNPRGLKCCRVTFHVTNPSRGFNETREIIDIFFWKFCLGLNTQVRMFSNYAPSSLPWGHFLESTNVYWAPTREASLAASMWWSELEGDRMEKPTTFTSVQEFLEGLQAGPITEFFLGGLGRT